MMIKRSILLIVTLSFLLLNVSAQNERRFVRKGNKAFYKAMKDTTDRNKELYTQAEDAYRKALNKKPKDNKWKFNLADAIYKQQKFKDAEEKFSELAESFEEDEDKAKAYHNLGNSQLIQNKIDESIASYKKSLRLQPNNPNTKYNLAYAQMLKKKQEQQQQQQNQNKQNQKDQQKDKNNQDNKNDQDKNKDKDQQDKNKQQDNKQQNNKDQNQGDKDKKDQKEQNQPQNKISKENAEQFLKALQNDEKKIQEKVKKAKASKAKKSNTEKEW